MCLGSTYEENELDYYDVLEEIEELLYLENGVRVNCQYGLVCVKMRSITH